MDVGLEHLPEQDVVVLRPVGDIDLDTAPDLRAALERAHATAAGCVVVDFAEVSFIDSVGIGQLVWLVRQDAPAHRVAVVNARPILRNAFTVMQLDRLLELHEFGRPPDWPGVTDTTGRPPW